MPPDDAVVSDPAAVEPALRYVPRAGLFRLVVVATLLNVLTLYFYRFWARTRWRRQIWGSILLRGDPLEYHGTGFELFKGFLVAMAVVAPVLIGVNVFGEFLGAHSSYLTVPVLGFLAMTAQFYAWKYRVSRTAWRGIRFGFDGTFRSYLSTIAQALGWMIGTGFIMYPMYRILLRKRLMSMTSFGNRRFTCEIDEMMPLYVRWAVVWLGYLACLGYAGAYSDQISRLFDAQQRAAAAAEIVWWPLAVAVATIICGYLAYRVAEFRVVAGGLGLGDVRFASRARPLAVGGRIALGIVAVLLACAAIIVGLLYATYLIVGNTQFPRDGDILTLLIFGAVAIVYFVLYLCAAVIRGAWIEPSIIRHFISTLAVENAGALDAVAAGAQDNLTRGEGLADSFDVGIA